MKCCLDYLIGYNSETHDNLIWNQKENWMAYSVENLLIIEEIKPEKN